MLAKAWNWLLTLLWGPKITHLETIKQMRKSVTLDVNANDTHVVTIFLAERFQLRHRGPAWVQKREHISYEVGWECEQGIPVNRHPTDGYWMTRDQWTYNFSNLDRFDMWVLTNLRIKVQNERIRNRYWDLPARNRRA